MDGKEIKEKTGKPQTAVYKNLVAKNPKMQTHQTLKNLLKGMHRRPGSSLAKIKHGALMSERSGSTKLPGRIWRYKEKESPTFEGRSLNNHLPDSTSNGGEENARPVCGPSAITNYMCGPVACQSPWSKSGLSQLTQCVAKGLNALVGQTGVIAGSKWSSP